ncbi:hypothetical protein GQ600_11128 [Phytophthora cactorum]|nr:hypothetical protein GQ600_11128 [Phytophthora cactorum]
MPQSAMWPSLRRSGWLAKFVNNVVGLCVTKDHAALPRQTPATRPDNSHPRQNMFSRARLHRTRIARFRQPAVSVWIKFDTLVAKSRMGQSSARSSCREEALRAADGLSRPAPGRYNPFYIEYRVQCT